MSRLYWFSHDTWKGKQFLGLKPTSVHLDHVSSQQWFRAGEGWGHSTARRDDLGLKYFNSLWVGLLLFWSSASGKQKAAIHLKVIEKNLISNLNRPFSSRDSYSEQMHTTADTTGPGIVIKAILSKKLSFWRLKVFLLTISIKGHHLPFIYSQMSLKIDLHQCNFGF